MSTSPGSPYLLICLFERYMGGFKDDIQFDCDVLQGVFFLKPLLSLFPLYPQTFHFILVLCRRW